MIQRKEYLQQLAAWRDEKLIKVVTGIRRCGKSTLLTQYQEYLHKQGATSEQIIALNFEDLIYEKTILTLDRFTPGDYEGIAVKNAIDWLLDD